jgi:hypothetical protein
MKDLEALLIQSGLLLALISRKLDELRAAETAGVQRRRRRFARNA